MVKMKVLSKFRNPCIKCLVRACCQESCDPYTEYTDFTVPFFGYTIVILSLIIWIASMFLIGIPISTVGGYSILVSIMWGFSFIMSAHILVKYDIFSKTDLQLPRSAALHFTLAPWVFWIVFLLYLYAFYGRAGWERNGNTD